jgi:uncharacterized membrane protein YfcA
LSDAIESVIDIFTFWDLILIGAGILLAGIVRGFVGFGASLIIVMVISVILGPRSAVAIATLSGLPSMLQLLPTAIRTSEKNFVIPFGIAAMIAAPLGTWFLIIIDPTLMRIGISITVLLMVFMLYKDIKLRAHSSLSFLIGVGITAGIIQGSAGIGGPPAVVIALSKPGTTEKQRANVIGAVTALGVCGILPLWYHGLFTLEVVIISIFLFPIYVGATWVGTQLFSKLGNDYFRNGALGILSFISIVTIAIPISTYLNVR